MSDLPDKILKKADALQTDVLILQEFADNIMTELPQDISLEGFEEAYERHRLACIKVDRAYLDLMEFVYTNMLELEDRVAYLVGRNEQEINDLEELADRFDVPQLPPPEVTSLNEYGEPKTPAEEFDDLFNPSWEKDDPDWWKREDT